MKRFLTMIVAVCAIFAASAQRPLVTLSHDGTLSFFSNLSAFEDAISAATDGDIIYLSEGQFTTAADTVKINKRLSIQGCGYKSRVMCHLKIDMRNNTADEIYHPLFDGVRLRSLLFAADTLNRIKTHNAEIRKSYIEKIDYIGYAAENVILDRCWIKHFDADGASGSNVTLQNSKIEEVPEGVQDYCLHMAYVTVINCNFGRINYLPKVTISSILGYASTVNGYRAYGSPALYNTLTYQTLPSGTISDGCYISQSFSLDDNCEVDESTLKTNNWLGQDGTVVGVYGGEFPFTENPSVPTVDSANSSVEYDTESNKLNVTITVLPN
ncbi:MAG: hypothetical protein K2K75_11590 [Muribaculaceae bacterium]|nr:hypothetical protein [Muribaculaceae bacterium]